VDPEFPWPFWFNHCILAVPAETIGEQGEWPVADGYVLIDPTTERGGVEWLHPQCQDRSGLLVEKNNSRLIRVPAWPEKETKVMEVQGKMSPSGDFTGEARFVLYGDRAAAWIDHVRTEPEDRVSETIESVVSSTISGAVVRAPKWEVSTSTVPEFRLSAGVRVNGMAAGDEGRRSLRLFYYGGLLEPRALEGRAVPVALRPGVYRTSWTMQLPSGWCPVKQRQESVDNPVGRFSLQVTSDSEGMLHADQMLKIGRSIVLPEEFDALRRLAIAENRSSKRTVRLRCER
jgi:hypothetical protein